MRKNMSSKIEKFESLTEFGAILSTMDDYRTIPIFTEYNGSIIRNERIKAMTNISKNRITMTTGKDYPVFGHRESLGYVYKELEARKCDVHGRVETVDDRTYTRILFKGLEVTDAKDSKVELGVSFENPMDRKTKFRGCGYTWRQTCSNGAGMKNMLPNMEINESHTVDMMQRVPPVIHDFITNVLASSNYLQTLVTKAMATKVVFDTREQMLNTMLGQFATVAERHVKNITAGIDTLEPTRWEMFNASNFYTSHHAISQDVVSQIDLVAESFLNVTRPINLVNARVVVPMPVR
jgi:hypothetical protein